MSEQVKQGEFIGLLKDVEYNTKTIEENKARLSEKANKDVVAEELKELKISLANKSPKSDVSLLQKIVFGTVATILAAFLAAVIQLVI